LNINEEVNLLISLYRGFYIVVTLKINEIYRKTSVLGKIIF